MRINLFVTEIMLGKTFDSCGKSQNTMCQPVNDQYEWSHVNAGLEDLSNPLLLHDPGCELVNFFTTDQGRESEIKLHATKCKEFWFGEHMVFGQVIKPGADWNGLQTVGYQEMFP